MLTIKAEASAGMDLREEMIPDLVRLARVTGCRVELSGNDTLFWAVPTDTAAELRDAFDRLYPHSAYVATWIKRAAPRVRSK